MMREQINLLEAMHYGGAAPATAVSRWLPWMLIALTLGAGWEMTTKGKEIEEHHHRILRLEQERRERMEAIGKASPVPVHPSVSTDALPRPRWSLLMREISRIIPEGVWTLTWNGDATDGSEKTELRIVGGALSHERLNTFLAALEQSPLLAKTALQYARRNGDHLQFEVLLRSQGEGT